MIGAKEIRWLTGLCGRAVRHDVGGMEVPDYGSGTDLGHSPARRIPLGGTDAACGEWLSSTGATRRNQLSAGRAIFSPRLKEAIRKLRA